MRYLLRLNPKAYNPLTKEVIESRLWEIEQCAMVGGNGQIDSSKMILHCADIRIDAKPICQLFTLPKPGEKPWETEVHGICVRGQDNVVEIHTGRHEAS